MSSKRNSTFVLLKFLLIIFDLLIIIDSIIHVVKDVQRLDDDKELNDFVYIMCIRIIMSLVSMFITYKEFSINHTITILLSIVYAIFMLIIMFVSPYYIFYTDNSLSLIAQIICTYLAISMAYKLIIIKFVDEEQDANKSTTEATSNERSPNISLEKNKFSVSRILKEFDKNILALSTLLTVIMAIVLGIILRNTGGNYRWSDRSLAYIGFPGEIFFRMLKGLILPLIFASLVYAMANIDTKLSGKIGARTFCYYLVTTVSAIILGIVLVVTIRPGDMASVDKELNKTSTADLTTEDTVLDLIRNLFPDNLIEACFQSFRTVLKPPKNDSQNLSLSEWEIESESIRGTNILGIVTFAISFGVVISQMREGEAKILLTFFKSFVNAIISITEIVIHLTPIAVLFLVLPHVLSVDEISELIASVGWFTLTVIIGLIIHGFIVLPSLYLLIARKNPFKLMIRMSAAIMTAFGTASSSATMPLTIKCLEENNHIDKRIVRFCVPLGASINMDGTALYEAVAAIFIAQYRDIDLSFTQIVIISITATAVSVGAAGIPQAGPITSVIVFNAVGLPVEDTALIFVVDWLLDRCRTSVNVLGDAFGTAIVDHLSKNDLMHFQSVSMT